MIYSNKIKYLFFGFCFYIGSFLLLTHNWDKELANFNYTDSKLHPDKSLSRKKEMKVFGLYWLIIESHQTCEFFQSYYPLWNIFILKKNLSNNRTKRSCMHLSHHYFLQFLNNHKNNLTGVATILQIFLFSIHNGAMLIYHKTDELFDDSDYLNEVIRVSTQPSRLYLKSKDINPLNSACDIFKEDIQFCDGGFYPVLSYFSEYSPNIHSKYTNYSNTAINNYNIKGFSYIGGIKLDLEKLSRPVFGVHYMFFSKFIFLLYLYESEEQLYIKSYNISKMDHIKLISQYIINEGFTYYMYYKSSKKWPICTDLDRSYLEIFNNMNSFVEKPNSINLNRRLAKQRIWIKSLQDIHHHSWLRGYDHMECSNITVENFSYGKNINSNYRQICRNAPSKSVLSVKINFKNPPYSFSNVLLIIVFNNAHYEVIPLLEILYRNRFRRIIYCGPHKPNDLQMKSFIKKINFVTFDLQLKNETAGAYNYECTLKAMNIGFRVDGYLTIADDLLLFADLSSFPLNQIWFQPLSLIHTFDYQLNAQCKLNECVYLPRWRWFLDYKPQVVKLLHDMQNTENLLVEQCLNALLVFNKGAKSRIHGAYSDIFYIPNRHSFKFTELAQYFLEKNIFLEIAVPTIMICLLSDNFALDFKIGEYKEIRGAEIWDIKRRDNPWFHWEYALDTGLYLHPTKWSKLFTKNDFNESKYKLENTHILSNEVSDEAIANLTDFLCNTVIPYMFDGTNL